MFTPGLRPRRGRVEDAHPKDGPPGKGDSHQIWRKWRLTEYRVYPHLVAVTVSVTVSPTQVNVPRTDLIGSYLSSVMDSRISVAGPGIVVDRERQIPEPDPEILARLHVFSIALTASRR